MPRPTRRLRLIAPGLSDRLLRVKKVMGSPNFCCDCVDSAAAVDWVRIMDVADGDGEERESNDIRE